jgi:catechol 2,3-dioxygenase-like lactoylglutathione lyase family enzyme
MVGLEDVVLRAVFLSVDGQLPYMELIEYRSPRSVPLRGDETPADVGAAHPCLLVDDVPAEYERLRALGVEFSGPPLLADEGVFSGQWAAYCVDPDGQVVELWSIPS